MNTNLPPISNKLEYILNYFLFKQKTSRLILQERSPIAATLKGELKVEPSAKRLATFMKYFDTD